MVSRHTRAKIADGIDSVGLWTGLTVFAVGLAIALPIASWVFAVKLAAIPFCVLLTQLMGRFSGRFLRRYQKNAREFTVDVSRTALLLLPFVLLFSVFGVREGSDIPTAFSAFARRFGLCLVIVPASLLAVHATLGLCEGPRRHRRKSERRRQ